MGTTVICPNNLCKKEYSEKFEKCPFCGTPKPSMENNTISLAGKELLVTTTNTIENAEIIEYIDIITINMVIGTNIFKDLFASFSDFFGGFSGKYKEQLERVYSTGLSQLKARAIELNANAIVGLHVDFDEISGKDKSMFMVAFTGTAVKIKKIPNYRRLRLLQELKSFLADGLISQEEYNREVKKIGE